jgi:sulfatase maturation enzyme AslB (radical SAM superfamily)
VQYYDGGFTKSITMRFRERRRGMDNEYLTICNDVSVHMTPTGISLFYQTFDPREVQKNIELSHHEKIILSKANGNTTVSNIRIDCESFIECRKFDLILQELIAKRMVVLTREKTKTKITGSKDYYVPRHISFEITSTCNFKCRHCYRDADSSQKEFIPKHDLLRFIGEAATNGVKIVEITGGECLMHPDAIEIIKGVADNPNLWIVAVLTNGWSLSDSLIEEFKGYERKVVFSVSLDSSVRDFHDDFRGMQGSWDRATDGIRKLSSKGFLCRASMSYIPASFFDIENTLLLAKELGAQCFGFSPVMPDGRGSVYAELFQLVLYRERYRISS